MCGTVPDDACLRQCMNRPCGGVVLQIAENDMISLPQCAVNRKIERVGAVLRKDNMLRQCVKQRGCGFPRMINRPGGTLCERMTASAWISALLTHGTEYRIRNRGRRRPACGCIVKINVRLSVPRLWTHRNSSFYPLRYGIRAAVSSG